MGESGRISAPASTDAAGDAADVPVAARRTSSARTLPSGPVPRSDLSSIPRSLAIRLAFGEARTRPPLGLVEMAGVVLGVDVGARAPPPPSPLRGGGETR